MEYIGSFILGDTLHARPVAVLCKTIDELYARHQGLRVEYKSLADSEFKAARGFLSLMHLMASCGPSSRLGGGSTIDIRVSGDLPEQVLRQCAERIGEDISLPKLMTLRDYRKFEQKSFDPYFLSGR